jgi:hypothetical protein
LCTEIVFDIQNNFCTQHVLPMFCKNKSFWQRLTCMIEGVKMKDQKNTAGMGISVIVTRSI